MFLCFYQVRETLVEIAGTREEKKKNSKCILFFCLIYSVIIKTVVILMMTPCLFKIITLSAGAL